jgi:AcrR family transcriptional regulator
MASASHPKSLKERQRQEREALILRAAADLLAERGYHEMSLDDIAARVGISKGTIYLHFASKEDLVIAFLEQGMTAFLQMLDDTLSGSATPAEKLRAIIDQVSSSMTDHRFLVIRAMLQAPEIHSRMAERQDEMRQRWDEPRRRLAAVIEQGKAEGAFDPTLPTPLILNLLMSLLTPHSYRRLVTEEGMTSAEVAAGLSRFFFRGIAPCGHESPITP